MVVIANTKEYLPSDWVRGVQYWLYLHSVFKKACQISQQNIGNSENIGHIFGTITNDYSLLLGKKKILSFEVSKAEDTTEMADRSKNPASNVSEHFDTLILTAIKNIRKHSKRPDTPAIFNEITKTQATILTLCRTSNPNSG